MEGSFAGDGLPTFTPPLDERCASKDDEARNINTRLMDAALQNGLFKCALASPTNGLTLTGGQLFEHRRHIED